MTETPLLAELWSINLEALPQSAAQDGPVIIADGEVYRLTDLQSPIQATRARVVGLRAAHMERLGALLRPKALALYDMQVEDLSPLQRLEGLEWLSLTWNTKATSLEPVGDMRGLTRLSISDMPKVRDLEPIRALSGLVALNYSGGIWNRATAATLEPLAGLPALEELVLTNIKVLEGGLRPLARCERLRTLELSNQFETADYAYLSVALPEAVCQHFAPYVPLEVKGLKADVMVVGRRKPFLDSTRDADRLARYVIEFERLRAGFRAELGATTDVPASCLRSHSCHSKARSRQSSCGSLPSDGHCRPRG